MTLKTEVKAQLEIMFPTCFTYIAPENISLLSCDCMQFTKSPPPLKHYPPREKDGKIEYRSQLLYYLCTQLTKLTDKSPVAVACFDKASPVVKKIVCHEKRYERRCKQCQAVAPDLPYGKTADASFFDPKCDRGCIDDQILWFEEGPHLGGKDAPLSTIIRNDWSRFASDSRNLFYELYPLIANQLLQWEPPIGRMLYVSGLPFNTAVVDEVKFNEGFAPTSRRADIFEKRIQLAPWPLDKGRPQYNMEILNRVYVFEGRTNAKGERMEPRREELSLIHISEPTRPY